MYVCVCMYFCMYVCKCNVCVCMCMYICMYACGYVCMYVYMHVCKEQSARGTSCRSPVPNKGRAVVSGNYNRHVEDGAIFYLLLTVRA